MCSRVQTLNDSKQSGMSGLAILLTIMVVIGMVVLAMRIVPHYIDFQTIRSIMTDLPGSQVHEMDKRTIINTLQKRFKINNVRSFKVRDVLTIDRSKAGTEILLDYEIREPLMGNAEIVLMFNEKYSYR